MRPLLSFIFLGAFILGLAASRAQADSSKLTSTVLDRDRTYEEDLRWEASDDKTMTPARAIRWIRGIRGAAIFDDVSLAEFQPIVHVDDSHNVRILGTIAFKFK